MKRQFYVPQILLPAWARVAVLYREYLPGIQMKPDSFVATPADAAAIFREREEEMALPFSLLALHRSEKETGVF